MKKEYERPDLELIQFGVESDVMTASVDTADFNDLQKSALGINLLD